MGQCILLLQLPQSVHLAQVLKSASNHVLVASRLFRSPSQICSILHLQSVSKKLSKSPFSFTSSNVWIFFMVSTLTLLTLQPHELLNPQALNSSLLLHKHLKNWEVHLLMLASYYTWSTLIVFVSDLQKIKPNTYSSTPKINCSFFAPQQLISWSLFGLKRK